ncbi:hypothetical protein VUJ46_16710 [Chryseobacterium sp. MYb264]|uniref:hypothetical protein n=1 Tax=Chryseobacterium sp. MYb264 TaxID=2745153 RepID=UPI002E159743|nr:hypothetical protein VUJ46_16710 [Chryseobacterium sp. MYb264]
MKVRFNIFIFGILFFLNGFVKAQKTSDKKAVDTVSYLRKFEMNKDKYIGKRFGLLMKDMIQMQPKMAKSVFNEDVNNPMTSTAFRFSEKSFDDTHTPTLIVKWRTDDIPTGPIQFAEEGNNYRFSLGQKNMLEKKIIKDIALVNPQ